MKNKRICLAIETTGPHLGFALHDMDGRGFPCVGRFFKILQGKQTDQFFPTLNRLLKARRLKRTDLALIAVDHGPGSFTGVRVGVAAARGIAQALALPIVGIGFLEALAFQAADGLPTGQVTIVARLPALPGDAYFAVFERSAKGVWRTVQAPSWTTEAAIDADIARLARAGAHLAFVPREGEKRVWPSGLVTHAFSAPDPSTLARLAFARCGARPSTVKFSIEKTVPIYLQPSWAERLKKPVARGAA